MFIDIKPLAIIDMNNICVQKLIFQNDKSRNLTN